ncbi:unnamed protein product [Camellia sinensis]
MGFKTNLPTGFWTWAIRAIRAIRVNPSSKYKAWGRAWAAMLGFMVRLGRAWALPNTIRVGLGQTPNPTEPAQVAPLGTTAAKATLKTTTSLQRKRSSEMIGESFDDPSVREGREACGGSG